MKTILVVCTANICRSPMAAALLRKQLDQAGLAGQVEVSSAGVWAREGVPASRHAMTALEARGAALDGHRARTVDVDLLQRADLVLVMEEAHRRSLFYLAPQCLNKVYLLAEMAGRHDDIDDPYGRSLAEYASTAQTLEQMIAEGLPNILKRLHVDTPKPSSANTSAA